MSGYRSLHREQILGPSQADDHGDNTTIALWQVQVSPLLLSPQAQRTSSGAWRVWTASSDGLVRSWRVQERSVQDKQDLLDASALSIRCTLALVETGYKTQDDSETELLGGGGRTGRIGCAGLRLARNYVGTDTDAGDWIVASLDLAGTVRVWTIPADFDDKSDDDHSQTISTLCARHEFLVESATGTSLEICPPQYLSDLVPNRNKNKNVAVVVGCLDGRIALVATGLELATTARDQSGSSSSAPSEPGTVLEYWSGRGSAIPLCLSWRKPSQPLQEDSQAAHSSPPILLAVGRQDGIVDILTWTVGGSDSSGKSHHQHRLHHIQGSPVRTLEFTDDGSLLVAGNDGGTIGVWDVSRRTHFALVHHIPRAHDSWIQSLATLPDSRRFVTASLDRKLCVWKVDQLDQPVHTFQLDSTVYSVVHRGGGSSKANQEKPPARLVTGSDTGWLQVFSLEN